jgi:hypothetical protein
MPQAAGLRNPDPLTSGPNLTRQRPWQRRRPNRQGARRDWKGR